MYERVQKYYCCHFKLFTVKWKRNEMSRTIRKMFRIWKFSFKNYCVFCSKRTIVVKIHFHFGIKTEKYLETGDGRLKKITPGIRFSYCFLFRFIFYFYLTKRYFLFILQIQLCSLCVLVYGQQSILMTQQHKFSFSSH